ncbi:MAG: choice-of-anchor J domain-containing protein, partial [Bacteroidales bacterium]|nr:choice-of-anchor J domain-containing protein [Bacteroidales bacterium]
AVNLRDNGANLGKQIKLRGNLLSYFGSPGLKDTDGYWLDGTGINPDDQIDPFFEEAFTSTLGSFTAHNVLGSQIWEWGNFDGGCAVISGFDGGTSYANEDWLVSPEIDLASRANVNLTIREAINFITSYDDMKVLISTDYDGVSLPTESGSWTELTGFDRPAGNSWTFSESGYIDISQYDGQKIYIGLKYTSSTTKSATWEVGAVRLTEVNE